MQALASTGQINFHLFLLSVAIVQFSRAQDILQEHAILQHLPVKTFPVATLI